MRLLPHRHSGCVGMKHAGTPIRRARTRQDRYRVDRVAVKPDNHDTGGFLPVTCGEYQT